MVYPRLEGRGAFKGSLAGLLCFWGRTWSFWAQGLGVVLAVQELQLWDILGQVALAAK